MSYTSEYEGPEYVLSLVEKLRGMVDPAREYRFMEFCGGHTHAFFHSGLIDLLPENITMVHGPGCPVCVLPSNRISRAITLLEQEKNLILCTYADLMRVPCERGDSLQQAKARGCDIRAVYSPLDALKLARCQPEQKIIFMAMGFETTTPPTVLALKTAVAEGLDNFFVYCNHVKTAPALAGVLSLSQASQSKLDGIIGPGHVAIVTGADFFKDYARRYKIPIVVSGFTAFDLVQALVLLVHQVNSGEFEVQTEYQRAVSMEGNLKAQELMGEFLEEREIFEWRGLGEIPRSGYRIIKQYARWDAEEQFSFSSDQAYNHPHCLCPKVLLGEANPMDCKLFGKACSPESPLGSCMVSSEGACAAYYQAGRHL